VSLQFFFVRLQIANILFALITPCFGSISIGLATQIKNLSQLSSMILIVLEGCGM
jgi:hypothetical protein